MHADIRHIHLLLFCAIAFILPAQNKHIPSAPTTAFQGRMETETIICTEMPGQKLLPVANINTVFQDSEGYIWFGTNGGGICRYNGYDMDIFRSDKDHPELLENNDVTDIAEDRHKNIWIGTRSRCLCTGPEKRFYTHATGQGSGPRENKKYNYRLRPQHLDLRRRKYRAVFSRRSVHEPVCIRTPR